MIITKEKVIPGKVALNDEELNIVIDFKILLERIGRNMDELKIENAGNITRHDVMELQNAVKDLYSNVNIDWYAKEADT